MSRGLEGATLSGDNGERDSEQFRSSLEFNAEVTPLDWFAWPFIGIKAGVITRSDVEGFNLGLTAR